MPLFQEQAMALAIHCAGFTPGEADQLRRAIAAWKRKEKVIFDYGRRIMRGMVANGYSQDFARQVFEQIKGFSEYGFPESHAASFALLVYVSAWLKHHHPAAFAAALLNSQPMGFYAPAQIVRDARAHHVEVRPVDVNHSEWDCTLEETPEAQAAEAADHHASHRPAFSGCSAAAPALRLGLRMVRGLREEDGHRITGAVAQHGPFKTIEALWRSSGVPASSLRRLASADAFASMGLDRQAALWQVRALRDVPLPLFDQCDPSTQTVEPAIQQTSFLPGVPPQRKVLYDYSATGLSLKAHPISFIRDELDVRGVTPAAQLQDETRCLHGQEIRVAGIVLVRQRPGTASGIVFATIEDETGIANLIIRPAIFDRDRQGARHSIVVLAQGRVERQGQVVHVMVQHIEDVGHLLPELSSRSRDFH